MRWDIGSVYKDIRKSKNLSQEEICGNTISRTTLSKFENNKLVPSYQTMEFLLRQVNVSFQEFNFLCNKDGKDKRQEIFNEFKTDSVNTDYPDEAGLENETFPEGAKQTVLVNKYERDS